jgi:hypothetical protein
MLLPSAAHAAERPVHASYQEKAGKGAGSLWGRVRSAVEVNELQVRKAVVNTSGMQGRPKTKVMRHVERLYGIELWDKSSRRSVHLIVDVLVHSIPEHHHGFRLRLGAGAVTALPSGYRRLQRARKRSRSAR